MTFSGASIETDLADLAQVMGIAHAIGARADAEHRNAERIVWTPDPNFCRIVPTKVQPPDGHAVAEARDRYLVSLYAVDFPRLLSLRDSLIAALDEVCSNEAYEVGGEGKLYGGGLDQQGFGLTIPIVIKRPIYDKVWRPVTVETTAASVIVTDAAGGAPQST